MRLPFGRAPRRSTSPAAADEDLTARWIEATVADSFAVDPDRLARVRAAVVGEHRLAVARAEYLAADALAARKGDGLGLTAPRVGQLIFGRRMGIVTVALVAVLAVSGVAAAASGPGQPFYGVRLTAESLTLPPAGTAAGVQARLHFLQERLGEVAAAAKHGDQHGAAAALGAYQKELVQLFPPGSPDPVDLGGVAVPGVDLPSVDGRLGDDSTTLEGIQPDLGQADASTATGVLATVDRIRAAIADQVARDQAAHDNAGSGDGLGPRVSDHPGAAASPTPSHGAGKKKHPMARPTETPRP